MKFHRYIASLLASIYKFFYTSINYQPQLAYFLGILFIVICFDINTKNITIIFKGEIIRLKKDKNSNKLYGQIKGKNVLATTKFDALKNKGSYLGAFRKLKRETYNPNQKKLITYHVFKTH